MFETPILFIVFNRPDTTLQVFEQIKKIKPTRLYIAADGPRADKLGEKELCEEVRSIVAQVDWDCEVKKLFQEENLGCGRAVSGAITWFFKDVEMGIILEDDCLPDLSFFPFCEKLLHYYKDDEEVMHISGNNFQLGKKIGDGNYYFSRYPHNWGWASWRRVWNKYDIDMNGLEGFIATNPLFDTYWIDLFTQVKNKKIDTWDYQYMYLLFKYHGKAILPNINLVKNIGFNDLATHTKGSLLHYDYQNFGAIKNIIHPSRREVSEAADKFTLDTYFAQKKKFKSFFRYNAKRIKHFFSGSKSLNN